MLEFCWGEIWYRIVLWHIDKGRDLKINVLFSLKMPNSLREIRQIPWRILIFAEQFAQIGGTGH